MDVELASALWAALDMQELHGLCSSCITRTKFSNAQGGLAGVVDGEGAVLLVSSQNVVQCGLIQALVEQVLPSGWQVSPQEQEGASVGDPVWGFHQRSRR